MRKYFDHFYELDLDPDYRPGSSEPWWPAYALLILLVAYLVIQEMSG